MIREFWVNSGEELEEKVAGEHSFVVKNNLPMTITVEVEEDTNEISITLWETF